MTDSSQKARYHRLSGYKDPIAVGLIATESNDVEIVRSTRRAMQLGYEVIIIHRGIPKARSVRIAEQLGANCIDSTGAVADIELFHKELIEYAEECAYSGIVLQTTPSQPIDLAKIRRSGGPTDANGTDFDDEPVSHSNEIVVGIPAYNEEIGIGSTVLTAQRHADSVIVVDDGSTDDTAMVASEAGATVIEHESNEGKGSAIQTLFEYSRTVEFDVLVLLDADGQHASKDIHAVAETVLEGDADLAIGSRYLSPSTDDETPAYRRFGQKILDYLTSHSSNVALTDTQSGFRALSAETIEKIRLRTNGIGVESEMVDQVVRRELSIREVPIDVRYEGIDGQTYNPIHHGLVVTMFLLQLVQDRHPLVFFGVPGILFILAGTLYGIDAILIYQTTGTFYPSKVLVAGFVTIFGVLGVFCGLVLNRITNLIRELEVSG
ncbi:glycosyltransferase family 2 protein [Haladaptatus caseinilyticus]|uniref:glycosyltransferase family 2 protein n=1 Tax=Haladaptatus caseinilyticus TaxID=2993314 RepID=UPI00224B1D84|nr:glycosyltransferase family 2 protein [Haladaptatus caseinilyticus]